MPHRKFYGRRISDPSVGIGILRAITELMVQQYHPVHVTVIEPFAAACQNDHREFQPFALVNAHDPHDIFVFTKQPGAAHIAASKPYFFNKCNEIEQPFITGFFEFSGPLKKDAEVCLPLKAAGHGARITVVSGVFIQIPDQFRGRHILRPDPPDSELIEECRSLVAYIASFLFAFQSCIFKRSEKIGAFAIDPDNRQFIR